MSLKLISVNIERSKHLERVLPFLRGERPQVVCLQELCEIDVPLFREIFPSLHFVPQTKETELDGRVLVHGCAIATASASTRYDTAYYAGDPAIMPESNAADPSTFINNNGVLISADIEGDQGLMRICTTHFTWSADGQATDLQREHMRSLLDVLTKRDEFVLCGDFNAPRGREIFGMLASRYKDEIPPSYMTSIDASLHRAGNLQLMVDGLFTTPAYTAQNVSLVGGVSDHLAIVAEVRKTQG